MSQTFGPYEPIRQAGDLYFVAGQVGVDPKTKQAPASFSEQMQLVIENMKSVLQTQNLSLKNVINVRVYLTDMNNFNEMNEIFADYFNGIGPSRECVGVAELPAVGGDEALQIEISAVAYRGKA